MTEQRTPDAERSALEAMVQSEGWLIAKEIVAAAYGPEAFEREFDAVTKELPPGADEFMERRVGTQVRAAFLAARNVVDLVESRLGQLQQATRARTETRPIFDSFRRGPTR